MYICAQLCGGAVRRLKYWPREKIRPHIFPHKTSKTCSRWCRCSLVVPIEETVIIACFDFIENNWKIDDSSSGLFKERGMELSLLLYCIPFVYSGQCSAFQRDTLPTHTGIINIESDVRPLQHQLHFITHTHT